MSTATGDAQAASNDYSLRIRSPVVEIPQDLVIPAIPRSKTIGELKAVISGLIPSHPSSRRQRLIYRGRLLDDDLASLATVLGDVRQDSEPIVIHLVFQPVAEESNQGIRDTQANGRLSNDAGPTAQPHPNPATHLPEQGIPYGIRPATMTFASTNRGPPMSAQQAMMFHQQAMQHQFAMLAQNQGAAASQSNLPSASPQPPPSADSQPQQQSANIPPFPQANAASIPAMNSSRQPIPLRQFHQAWNQQHQGLRDSQHPERLAQTNSTEAGAQPTTTETSSQTGTPSQPVDGRQPGTHLGGSPGHHHHHPQNHIVSVRNMRFQGLPIHGLPAPPMVNFMPPPFMHAPQYPNSFQPSFGAGLPLADGELYLLSSPQGPEALLWNSGRLYRGSQTFGRNAVQVSNSASNVGLQNQGPRPTVAVIGNTIVPTNPRDAQQLGMEVEEVDILQLIGRAFVPLAGHLWLILRLAGFMYLFMGGATWQRIFTLSIGAFILVAAQAGMLRPITDSIWGMLRSHHNRVAGHGQPENAGALATNNNELDPQALAERLLAQQQQRAQNAGPIAPVMQVLGQLERSLTLFVASLVPGLGDHRPPVTQPPQIAPAEAPTPDANPEDTNATEETDLQPASEVAEMPEPRDEEKPVVGEGPSNSESNNVVADQEQSHEKSSSS